MGVPHRLAMVGALMALSGLLSACGNTVELRRSPTPSEACPPGTAELAGGSCEPAGLRADLPCPPGEVALDDGRCDPAGLPSDMACPPGELEVDGACRKAGLQPGDCDPGFVHDGDVGCDPILPEETCPFGLMAVPGDAECREIMPCGEGTWGDIPVEANTQYVDASYVLGDSDGSAVKPWATIQEGIDAAEVDAVVAVAAGTYPQDLVIDKPVRLMGRCPAMVEVVGQEDQAVLVDGPLGSAPELSGLSIIGADRGLVVDEGHVVATTLNAHGSYIALHVEQGSVDVQQSVFESRDTVVVVEQGAIGIGRSVLQKGEAIIGLRASGSTVQIRGSVVGEYFLFGIDLGLSQAEIHGSVVRSGVYAYDSPFALSGCVIESSGHVGIDTFRTAGATIDRTVIREHGPPKNPDYLAANIEVTGSDEGASSTTISRSLIERSVGGGVKAELATVDILSTVIREHGTEIASPVRPYGVASVAGETIIRGTIIESNLGAGIRTDGGQMTLEASLIANTPAADGPGVGVFVLPTDDGTPALLTVQSSRITGSDTAGIWLSGSTATIERSEIGGTRGITVGDDLTSANVVVLPAPFTLQPSSLTLSGTRIDSAYSGADIPAIALRDSALTLEDSHLVGRVPDGARDTHGVLATVAPAPGVLSTIDVRRSLIEQFRSAGVSAEAASVFVEDSVIRDIGGSADGGVGLFVASSPFGSIRALLDVSRSLVERTEHSGIFLLGADAEIDRTAVLDTAGAGAEELGNALTATTDGWGNVPHVLLTDSRFADSSGAGARLFGAELTYSGTAMLCGERDISRSKLGEVGVKIIDDGRNGCGCPDATGECAVTRGAAASPARLGQP